MWGRDGDIMFILNHKLKKDLTNGYRNCILEHSCYCDLEGGEMSTFEINMEYEGRKSNFLMGMYVYSSMADDLDMIGLNLCDCDDKRFKEQVGECRIDSETIKLGKARVVVSLGGNDEDMKERTIEELIDCLDDLVWRVRMGLNSRLGGELELFSLKANIN